MKLLHPSTSMKSALAYVYLFRDGNSKGHVPDKAMQETSEALDNVLRTGVTRLCSGITN